MLALRPLQAACWVRNRMVKPVRLREGKQQLSRKGLLLQLIGRPMHAGQPHPPPPPSPRSRLFAPSPSPVSPPLTLLPPPLCPPPPRLAMLTPQASLRRCACSSVVSIRPGLCHNCRPAKVALPCYHFLSGASYRCAYACVACVACPSIPDLGPCGPQP